MLAVVRPPLSCSVPWRRRPQHVLAGPADDLVEQRRLALVFEELVELQVAPATRPRARLVVDRDLNQATDVPVHRVGVQQHALDHAEDRRRRADAEGQRQDRGHREGRLLAHAADRVADVLSCAEAGLSPRARDAAPRPRVPRPLADRRRVAERAARREARFVGRDAVLDAVVCLRGEVGAKLAVQFGVALFLREELPEGGQPATCHGLPLHAADQDRDFNSDRFSTRPMARESCCQFDSSAASCRRPAGVSR